MLRLTSSEKNLRHKRAAHIEARFLRIIHFQEKSSQCYSNVPVSSEDLHKEDCNEQI